MFREAKYALWHANLAARRISARHSGGKSGIPQYNAHANDIDFQIESDFIGLMAPGLPQMRQPDGAARGTGDELPATASIGGMFVSGMYAAAFFERDPTRWWRRASRRFPRRAPTRG